MVDGVELVAEFVGVKLFDMLISCGGVSIIIQKFVLFAGLVKLNRLLLVMSKYWPTHQCTLSVEVIMFAPCGMPTG